MMRKF